ncbi:replication factor C large subunit [Methanoculleus sp. FWC-SCC1]|uniref:Replication factor C large subunit n=1 Tax=Methanoculleus frigidifontis TaxID=2584085 RepID=A0ABT8M8E7_9EURY|nr:replication factor C large subunit [Methanoculleus sp. FWC-SCC1]MDN7024200.1 replication factor C large subunit [Methanoculleus sp. FWC-SCC1]
MHDTTDWTEKYRPCSLGDIVGNTSAVRQMYEWAKTWTPQSKPLVLYGKPGIGKTSSAYALANDMNWEVVELNASDQRTKQVIDRIAGSSSTTGSLSGAQRKVIILDEADNLHAHADRGGARAIVDIIAHSRQPIILIANDYYGLAKELKKVTEPVQFRALQARSIAPRLRYICSAEGIACPEEVLAAIAERAGGDMRAAVNMLHAAAIGRETLQAGDIHTGEKDERSTIFDLVAAVFGKRGDEALLKVSYDVEDTPDTIEQWIEGNLQHMPDFASRARGYDSISRADEYIGRTYRRQYYTLWRYATALMLLGVADAAGGHGIHGRITSPERWGKMSRSRRQKAIRTELLRKLSRETHTPQSTLREEFFTAITLLVEQDPARAVREFDLDADELTLFLHDKAAAAKVVREVAKEAKAAEKKETASRKKTGKTKAETDPPKAPEDAKRPDVSSGQSTLF